jgi:hypothetical protein
VKETPLTIVEVYQFRLYSDICPERINTLMKLKAGKHQENEGCVAA